tara:strand:+ start:190 stop:822 length:633 start_codon:yes stop_codon:yes gene_type:complete
MPKEINENGIPISKPSFRTNKKSYIGLEEVKPNNIVDSIIDDDLSDIIDSNPTTPDNSVPKNDAPASSKTQPVIKKRTPVSSSDLNVDAITDTMSDPLSGWIVIIKGPGQGAYFPLRYGKNFIGRDKEQAVNLDFGDATISRQNHCSIEYDGRDKAFYLNQGDGRNSPRLNSKRMAEFSVEISNLDEIEIGETVLKFVALCGADFCWDAT